MSIDLAPEYISTRPRLYSTEATQIRRVSNTAGQDPDNGRVDKKIEIYQQSLASNYLSEEHRLNEKVINQFLKYCEIFKNIRDQIESKCQNIIEISQFLYEKMVYIILKHYTIKLTTMKQKMFEKLENILHLNEWKSFTATEAFRLLAQKVDRLQKESNQEFQACHLRSFDNVPLYTEFLMNPQFNPIYNIFEFEDSEKFYRVAQLHTKYIIREINHKLNLRILEQQQSSQISHPDLMKDNVQMIQLLYWLVEYHEVISLMLMHKEDFFPKLQRAQLYVYDNLPQFDLNYFQALRNTIYELNVIRN